MTGGASVCGLGVAMAFARAGALPILVDIDADAVARAVRVLRAEGHVSHGYDADLTDGQDVREVLAAIRDNFGPYSKVVNCVGAGVEMPPGFGARTPADQIVDLNREALTDGVEAAARHWFGWGDEGRILNIAAVPPAKGCGWPPKSARKTVSEVTRAADRRWGRLGVRVNAVILEEARDGEDAALVRDTATRRPTAAQVRAFAGVGAEAVAQMLKATGGRVTSFPVGRSLLSMGFR
ncbi:MAG: SDR family NAD(P)-dependent oxidoreductase [Caulobacteraceae bacterium]